MTRSLLRTWFEHIVAPRMSLVTVALSLVWLSHSSVAIAQSTAASRAAPSLGPLGLPQANQSIPDAIVTWGYWGIRAETCTDDGKATRCIVNVGHGDRVERSICLNNAALHFSPTDSASVMLHPVADGKTLLLPARKQSPETPVCFAVKGHGSQVVVATLATNGARKPLAISMSLEERVDVNPASSSFKARAKMPLIAPLK